MPSVLCLVLFFAFCFRFALLCFASLCCYLLFAFYNKCNLSLCMGFPTVGYVRVLCDYWAAAWVSFGF